MKKKEKSWLEAAASQNVAYLAIALFFILYLFSGFWLFGLLAGASILLAVFLEFWEGAKKHGLKKELKETALALLLALAVWFGASFLLQTPSPLNAIVSCSMLPNLNRGDLIVLSGDRLLAPTEEISSIEGIGMAEVFLDANRVAVVKGSIYAYCSNRMEESLCKNFVNEPERFRERHGEIVVGYGRCDVVYPAVGKKVSGPCVSWLEANGKRHYENLSNDIVVYQPAKDEYYSRVGDIIHRVFIKLKARESNQTYFLTKGDNNPIFDFQVYDEGAGMGNRPVEVERSKGRVLWRIPVIGYLKLFISPQAIFTPEGCERHYAKYAG
ncbi:MAG: hypothetical protein N3G22_02435 [Candidatus Micrarchaeota archaeon]|nr:hypothetical protein [Candidatus Micrarchaeota archaeon]